jgi:hypothetical protein
MTTPDFETLYPAHETTMLKDAYQAITKADMWEYMRLPTTPGKDGFMFSSAIELALINAAMTYEGHSGASYAWTMRVMASIAKKGWEAHTNDVRRATADRQLKEWADTQHKPKGNPCPC